MELNKRCKSIKYSMSTIGTILALTCSLARADATTMLTGPGKIYVGIFGGVASPNNFDIDQYGTVFFPEALGGALAVNAVGKPDNHSVKLIGGHVGYQWTEVSLNSLNLKWGLIPAIELEGYYLGKSLFIADEMINDTTRLSEQDFSVDYPTRTRVFLTNFVFNVNSSRLGRLHPYVGIGLGSAVASISNATATQVSPPEPGINHYNSGPSDTATAFAGQAKVGLNCYLTDHIALFVEYRWLYLSSTSYIFGPTVYAEHAVTSNWQVKMGPQNYNIGAIGAQFNL